jgi:hypothetical protein
LFLNDTLPVRSVGSAPSFFSFLVLLYCPLLSALLFRILVLLGALSLRGSRVDQSRPTNKRMTSSCPPLTSIVNIRSSSTKPSP